METLVAEISIDSVRNTMSIYHSEINGNNIWTVKNYQGKETHNLCESFDQAVKYACEYLGLIYYKKR